MSNTEKIHNAMQSGVLFDELRRVSHCDETLLRVSNKTTSGYVTFFLVSYREVALRS